MPTINSEIQNKIDMTHLAVHGIKTKGLTFKDDGLMGAAEAALNNTSYRSPVLEPANGLIDAIKDYSEAKNEFTSGLKNTIDDADEAASALSSANFGENEEDEIRTSRSDMNDEVESLRARMRENAREREEQDEETLGAVREFVSSYNEAAQFLNENREVSEKVSAIADDFNDTSKSVRTLSAIGVTSDEEGRLSVDEEKLRTSMRERPESVEYALGKDGLAGRAQRSIDRASRNAEKLFPKVSTLIGRDDDTAKEMYSGRAKTAKNDFSDRGALFNLYY